MLIQGTIDLSNKKTAVPCGGKTKRTEEFRDSSVLNYFKYQRLYAGISIMMSV